MSKMDHVDFSAFYEKNKTEINFLNMKSIKVLSGMGSAIIILYIILSFYMFERTSYRDAMYLIFGGLIILLWTLFFITKHLIQNEIKSYRLTYFLVLLLDCAILGSIIVISTVLSPNLNGVFFVIFNILVPNFLLLRKRDSMIMIIVSAVVFSGCVFLFKNKSIIQWDLYLAASSLIIGIPITLLLNRVRMEDAYIKYLYLNQANHDVLTSMPNRRSFNDVYEDVFSRHIHKQDIFAVAILDIDDFKQYNDLYGHIRRDQIIKHVADVLKRFAERYQIFVARLGGDEFGVLAVNYTHKHLVKVFEELLEDVSTVSKELMPILDNQLGISIGVYEVNHRHENAMDCLEMADKALYEAKSKGKGKIVFIKNT